MKLRSDYLFTNQGNELKKFKRSRVMKWLSSVFLVLAILCFLMVLGVYRLEKLNAKPIEPSSFSWINKVEIYALGAIMSIVAAPLYPEVSREHMMLYTPFGEKPEIINDDFFMGSLVVKKAINQSINTGQSYRLAWPASDYQFSFNNEKLREARIALALNGGYLRVESNKVFVKVKISYPQKSFAPLFAIPGFGLIGVEEGLFWVLQQEGWYHTGYVEWVAQIIS